MSRTLSQRLREGPLLDPLEAQRVALHALDALRAAHKADRAHTALTPEAVVLEEDGRATLTDRWAPASPESKASNVHEIASILSTLFPAHPVLTRAASADPARRPDVTTLRRDLAEAFHRTR